MEVQKNRIKVKKLELLSFLDIMLSSITAIYLDFCSNSVNEKVSPGMSFMANIRQKNRQIKTVV